MSFYLKDYQVLWPVMSTRYYSYTEDGWWIPKFDNLKRRRRRRQKLN